MKPFNIEEALAGKPVVNKFGWPVTQLKLFDGVEKGSFPLVGVVAGKIGSWTMDGRNWHYGSSDYDLFMAPTKKSGWIAIYSPPKGEEKNYPNPRTSNFVYETEEEARTRPFGTSLAVIRIEWEE